MQHGETGTERARGFTVAQRETMRAHFIYCTPWPEREGALPSRWEGELLVTGLGISLRTDATARLGATDGSEQRPCALSPHRLGFVGSAWGPGGSRWLGATETSRKVTDWTGPHGAGLFHQHLRMFEAAMPW